ncbi:hypothetical protein WME99_30030 [Sorangium sp. So ce136]|uniref:hypothetical protein n=1 Tax=Sorangium sp. So ce136 TaxID=3133284 RepID=UPI003F042742
MNKGMGHRLGAVAIASTALALGGCGESGNHGASGSGGSGGVPGNARKSFVYTITNPDGDNGIEAFARDPETGKLTRLGRTMTGGRQDHRERRLRSRSDGAGRDGHRPRSGRQVPLPAPRLRCALAGRDSPRAEIHVLQVDEESESGALTHVQSLALPDDLESTGVMGMLIVDR